MIDFIRDTIRMIRQANAFAKANDGRTQWAFMKPFNIKNADGTDYLKRLRIFQCPWFGILLHEIRTPDPQPDLHDHPYPFLAIPLRGGYYEQYAASPEWGTKPETRYHSILKPNVMPVSSAHRIISLTRVPTWTLLFVGPRIQTFGFWTEDGYVPFEDYSDKAFESGDESRMLHPKPEDR